MRILFVTTSYPVSRDDPRGNHVRVLARQLAADGDDMTVVAPARAGAPLQDELEGVHVRRFRYWPGGGSLATNVAGIIPSIKENPFRAAQVPGFVAAMARATRAAATDCDVIHAHWLFPSGTAAVRAGRRLGKPVLVTSHGGDAELARKYKLFARLAGWTVRGATGVTAVSDAIATELNEISGGTTHISVVPLGVSEPEGLASAGGEPARFLYVGSLIHRKGIDILLDALDLSAAESIRLAIVGDGPLHEEVRRRTARHRGVEVLGALPPRAVAEEMRRSSVLVLPSRSEGRPFAVMEAMAHGLPVIATDIPGTRELVRDEESGLLCKTEAHELAAAMTRLAEDAALRERLGKGARAYLTAAGLTSEAAAARMRTAYREAMA